MQSSMWGKVKDNWRWEAVAVRGGDGNIKGTLSVLIRRLPVLKYTLMYGGRGPGLRCPRPRDDRRNCSKGYAKLAKKISLLHAQT